MQLLEREHRRLVVNKFTHEQVFKIVGAVFAFKLLNVEQRAATFQGILNGDNLPPLAVRTEKTSGKGVMTDVDFHAFGGAGASPVEQFTRPERVLEKLGVINKESDTLDQTAARTNAATYGSGGYIPATISYAGYQAYQPVTAPAGRSYVDQSKNEYHISLTGGTAPGTQLDRQLQDALEKYERDKRARARASMMHDG